MRSAGRFGVPNARQAPNPRSADNPQIPNAILRPDFAGNFTQRAHNEIKA
jgi:hypothetical protein